MVRLARRQPPDRLRDGAGSAGARAVRRSNQAVGRRRPVLEVPLRGVPARVDRPGEGRRVGADSGRRAAPDDGRSGCRERLVGAAIRSRGVGGDDANVVDGARSEARRRHRDVRRAGARADALRGRLGAVARARAVVEVHGGGLSVRIYGCVQRGARVLHAGRWLGRDARGARGLERPVGAATRAGVARCDEPEVVRTAARQSADRRADGDRARAGACVFRRGVRAVARARSILEMPARRAAARIDRAVERCRRCRDAARCAGHHLRRRGGRQKPVGAASGAGGARRDDAIVVARPRREPTERR